MRNFDEVIRFIHMCGMTHSYVLHDSFACVCACACVHACADCCYCVGRLECAFLDEGSVPGLQF